MLTNSYDFFATTMYGKTTGGVSRNRLTLFLVRKRACAVCLRSLIVSALGVACRQVRCRAILVGSERSRNDVTNI